MARDIGESSILLDNNDPSIIKIQENLSEQSVLNFQSVEEIFISKDIYKLSLKKATGHDGISAKILKLA